MRSANLAIVFYPCEIQDTLVASPRVIASFICTHSCRCSAAGVCAGCATVGRASRAMTQVKSVINVRMALHHDTSAASARLRCLSRSRKAATMERWVACRSAWLGAEVHRLRGHAAAGCGPPAPPDISNATISALWRDSRSRTAAGGDADGAQRWTVGAATRGCDGQRAGDSGRS